MMFRSCIQSCPRILRNHLYTGFFIEFSIPRSHSSHGMIRVPNRQLSHKISVVSQEILKDLQNKLDGKILGQPHATKAIVDSLHVHAAGLGDPRLPIANLLFLGPTGVGKTELAKVLAESIYGSREALLQFDMSKYTHSGDVNSFVGSPPGYVDSKDGGLLTQPVIQKSDQVILFDEFEKADPSLYKLLLSVTGSGEIADKRGQVALFNRSIIIFTSNLYSLKIQELFNENLSPKQIEEELRLQFMQHFSPEFYGRITPIIFTPACKTHLKQVIDKMLGEIQKRIETKTGVYLNIDDSIRHYIEKGGFSPELGFRPTARFIEQKIVLPIAKLINEAQAKEGQVLDVKYSGGINVNISFALEISKKNLISNQIRHIKHLVTSDRFLKNFSEALKLYENLYSKSFAHTPDWPEEFVALSLQIGKKCLEEKHVVSHLLLAQCIFTDLVAKGHVEAKAYLGEMFLTGWGVPKKEDEALKLFIEASALDDPLAHFHLGNMYLKGLGGLDYNPYLAEQYFDKALVKGSAKIINQIGMIYRDSQYIWVKAEKWVNCFKRASELGEEPEAYYNLGLEYLKKARENKPGEEQYLAKSIDCLLKAGHLGNKNAYLQLAKMYYLGAACRLPIDNELAKRYETLAQTLPEKPYPSYN